MNVHVSDNENDSGRGTMEISFEDEQRLEVADASAYADADADSRFQVDVNACADTYEGAADDGYGSVQVDMNAYADTHEGAADNGYGSVEVVDDMAGEAVAQLNTTNRPGSSAQHEAVWTNARTMMEEYAHRTSAQELEQQRLDDEAGDAAHDKTGRWTQADAYRHERSNLRTGTGLEQAHLDRLSLKYAAHDVLADDTLRQGIKDYSEWPTIPQLFLCGEFIGGSDIVLELYQSGELLEMIEIAAASS